MVSVNAENLCVLVNISFHVIQLLELCNTCNAVHSTSKEAPATVARASCGRGSEEVKKRLQRP